jgi:hypothetical protein
MSNEVCTLALKNALNEIRSVCPEITHTFIFTEDGENLAEDQNTNEASVNDAQEAFRALADKSEPVGRIDSATFKGSQGRINFTKFNDFYVANVSSNEADQKTVTNLTRVMIPTMLKLVRQGIPDATEQLKEPEFKVQPIEIKARYEEIPVTEPGLPEIQASQFMVENLGFGGFMTDPDTVLVDTAQIGQGTEMFGDKHISKVVINNIETGKNIICGFKPIKESKFEGKGIIQIPEKIRITLHVQKGDKVSIKPVLENPENSSNVSEKTKESVRRTLFSRKNEKTPPQKVEPYMHDAPVSQFIVENLKGMGGFLGTPDFVRVDRAIIAQWKEVLDGKEIKEVILEETRTGKKVRCFYQPIKDSNLEGKGLIQIPEKAQQMLQTKKGALVVVKPVVE